MSEKEANPNDVEQLRQAVMAGWRLKFYGYYDWRVSGGHPECGHGIAVGIHCERCDQITVEAMQHAKAACKRAEVKMLMSVIRRLEISTAVFVRTEGDNE